MDKRIAVLGAGAVGSNVGALLTRAGHDVMLIDAWPAHVDAMKASGLHITMPEEEFTVPVRAMHVYEMCTLADQFDTVLLCCKSYDTRWMTHLVKPYLAPGGVLVSVQNSLNEEWIASILGDGRVVGCVLSISCELWEPGRAKRNSVFDHITFTVGEISGRLTPRVNEIVDLLSSAGKASATTNLWGALWSKLVLNTMDMQIAAITGQTAREMVQDPGCIQACMVLGKETIAVGKALGYQLEPIFGLSTEEFEAEPEELLQKLLAALVREVRDARGTIWYDLAKGRRTETDYMNGLVAEKGSEYGVHAPANEAVAALMKRLERKELICELSNLELLQPAFKKSGTAVGPADDVAGLRGRDPRE